MQKLIKFLKFYLEMKELKKNSNFMDLLKNKKNKNQIKISETSFFID